MKILITGGSGFVGSNLAIFLKNNHPDWHIYAFDNLKRRGSELNIASLIEGGVEYIHGDIRNDDDLEQFTELTHIIDASAEPSVTSGIHGGLKQLININLLGTINLIHLANHLRAHFIFLSTSRVYPIEQVNQILYEEADTRFEISAHQNLKGVSKKGISEDFPIMGYKSYYGATKLSCEMLLTEFQKYAGIKTVINRFGVIAGPRQMGKVDQGVAVLWMARHYWKGKLGYFGYGGMGKQVRDMLHIEDLCELIEHQIENINQYSGQTFNVGGGRDVSLSLMEMTSLCREITGNTISIEPVLQDREADIRIYLTDNSKIEQTTSWTPKRNVQTLFEDIFNWMRNNEKQLEKILN